MPVPAVSAVADSAPTPPPIAPLFSWLQQRSTGVLLHPTCLPGDQGCGVLDAAVDRFLDFLVAAGISAWQLCPLGPTGYGDSPYQCFSAFAGNPYLIDLRELTRFGLLTTADLAPLAALPRDHVDYGALYHLKWPLLRRAHAAWAQDRTRPLPYGDFVAFCEKHAAWLEAYAAYRALKDHFGGQPWWEWPAALRSHAAARDTALLRDLAPAVEAHAFTQYLFFGQWRRVRAAAASRGLQLVGDMPIYVAMDGADTWAAPHLFELDAATGRPLGVAGVPPDYFSADGQLWGNPLYRWDVHAAEGYAWWLARLRAAFAQADIVRIDHFRAFDTYWRIPAAAETAREGDWLAGPGLAFFQAVHAAFPEAKIIAEDLGELAPTVHALRAATGLPGMTILQFAFGGSADNLYLPHNLEKNSVIYPGTHDNDTTRGWYASADEKTRDHVRRYLRVSGDEIGWDFVRVAYAAPSRLAVLPLQDLLSLDTTARFNTPGRPDGNWGWRATATQLDALFRGPADYLKQLGTLCGRA